MSKFKVGDKVRILNGSKIDDYTGDWASDMRRFVGEVRTIKSINEHWDNDRVSYTLDGSYGYAFDERGLELVSKFKVGDKVIANKKANDRYSITNEGWIGTVTEIHKDGFIMVKGKIPDDFGDGFVVKEECFDLYEGLSTQKIVIKTDGKVTTAVLYDGKKRINEAKSTCSSTDTFDFGTSAALALERLVGNPNATIDLDWGKFAAGKLDVKVSKDKWDEFMKLCEEKDFTWPDGQKPTTFNMWKFYNNLSPIGQAIIDLAGDIPGEHAYMIVKNGHLKWSNEHDKDLSEYEFI